MTSSGTTPEGAQSEQEASRWVRSMFGRVAHRYDLANHLLSANIDKHWRTHTVSKVRDVLMRPGSLVMDLACGTGDLLVALERDVEGNDDGGVASGNGFRGRRHEVVRVRAGVIQGAVFHLPGAGDADDAGLR